MPLICTECDCRPAGVLGLGPACQCAHPKFVDMATWRARQCQHKRVQRTAAGKGWEQCLCLDCQKVWDNFYYE